MPLNHILEQNTKEKIIGPAVLLVRISNIFKRFLPRKGWSLSNSCTVASSNLIEGLGKKSNLTKNRKFLSLALCLDQIISIDQMRALYICNKAPIQNLMTRWYACRRWTTFASLLNIRKLLKYSPFGWLIKIVSKM